MMILLSFQAIKMQSTSETGKHTAYQITNESYSDYRKCFLLLYKNSWHHS